MASLEEFKLLDIRIGTILKAERIEQSEKLLRLEVDLGQEQRQILSGIGKYFNPEDLEGKQIPVICGIPPKTMLGLESQGMILAADDSETPILLHPEKEIPPGTPVM